MLLVFTIMIPRAISNIIRTTNNIYLHNLNFTRNYAFKSDLKIKWVRPEKIPCTKPQKSGDLEPINTISSNEFLFDFKNSQELQSADDVVKKLFTVGFAPRAELIRSYRHEMVDRVKRHTLDNESIEVKIASWTGAIRSMQDNLEKDPQNKVLKVRLKELIDKRKKRLKFLRMWDYKKFEWLIEKLNIVYKPTPLDVSPVTRKDSLRKLTKIYCDKVRNEKLEAYKKQLEQEQPVFLQEKIRTLEYVRDEQKRLNVPVTVEQEEIDNAKILLKQLQEKLSQENLE